MCEFCENIAKNDEEFGKKIERMTQKKILYFLMKILFMFLWTLEIVFAMAF